MRMRAGPMRRLSAATENGPIAGPFFIASIKEKDRLRGQLGA